jgi:DNA repair exonuclease SbcCD nuclease subunit
MTHLGLSGAVTGKRNYVMQDTFSIDELLPEKFKYVILGHYHKPQLIQGVNNALYTGSPLQHNFNDEGEERGYWVVDTSKRFDMKLVPLDSPKFITLTSDNYKDYDPETNKDFVKVHVSKDKQVVAICDDLHSKVGAMDSDIKIEIVKEYKQEGRSDIKVGMSYSDIVKKYAEEHSEVEGLEKVGLSILEKAMTEC